MKISNLFNKMAQASIYISLFTLISCQTNHKSTPDYYAQVDTDFEKVKLLAANRSEDLFSVFDTDLNDDETRYLKFLYAYMPLSDLADYDGSYFLEQVQTALEAKEYFTWGAAVPDDIFRHFVLPYRVNNENPDTSRKVFFEELKPRLENLNMYDAALEVNHWCHEKVEYRATSERTIAPLGIVKSAFGRCGEESTFTVTALRAVGIPARQVYTPRWAHCDDNHAWVEVWIEGKWYFIGACEPEAKLNRGWFSKPVLRAMMVHTRVFGKYESLEAPLKTAEKFTKINVIENYVSPVIYEVHILDENNKGIDSATVEFQLYNYAEFYPIATQTTNSEGKCSIKTNHGSLMIFAYKNQDYAYGILRSDTSQGNVTLNLTLHQNTRKTYDENLNIIVPPKQHIIPDTSGNEKNALRIKYEDSVRNAYINTFPGKETAIKLAKTSGFSIQQIQTHLEKSRGNYTEIEKYFNGLSETNKTYAISLLEHISEKDHRDTPAEVLLDHLLYAIKNNTISQELFVEYVLNPRIANEKIISYKHFFQQSFNEGQKLEIQNDPKVLINQLKTDIRIANDLNYAGTPLSPIGTYELKVSDKWSRNICLVAIYRSLGIPARLEPATKIPQYYFQKVWNDVYFEKEITTTSITKGKLQLKYSGNESIKYRIHFALAKYQDNTFKTLDYGWETPIEKFNEALVLDTGYYVLTTGKRLENGDVMVHRKFFTITNNGTVEIPIQMRSIEYAYPELGKLENHTPITKPLIMCWLSPSKEPSKHLLLELNTLKQDIDTAEISIILICPEEEINNSIITFNLPANWFEIANKKNEIIQKVKFNNSTSTDFSPVCIVVDTNNTIRLVHSGYEVGISEKLLKTAKAIK